MRSSEATASPAMSSFLAREGLDRALPANLRISLSKEAVGGEIVDRDRNHQSVV